MQVLTQNWKGFHIVALLTSKLVTEDILRDYQPSPIIFSVSKPQAVTFRNEK